MRPASTFLSLLLLSALVGCLPGGGDDDDDDGGDGSSGPLTPAEVEALCMADCERDFMCDPMGQPVAECVASCTAEFAPWVRDDAFETVFECSAALPCGQSDDGCAAMVSPQAAHVAYETRCREVMSVCLQPTEVDELCDVDAGSEVGAEAGFIRFIDSAIVIEMTACFDQGCQMAIACLQTVLQKNGVDF